VPKNIDDLINLDLKKYIAKWIILSFMKNEFCINENVVNCNAILCLGNKNLNNKITEKYINENTDITKESLQIFNENEIINLLHFASQNLAKDKIILENILEKNNEISIQKLESNFKKISKFSDIKNLSSIYGVALEIFNKKQAILGFTNKNYANEIFSGLLKYSLINL